MARFADQTGLVVGILRAYSSWCPLQAVVPATGSSMVGVSQPEIVEANARARPDPVPGHTPSSSPGGASEFDVAAH